MRRYRSLLIIFVLYPLVTTGFQALVGHYRPLTWPVWAVLQLTWGPIWVQLTLWRLRADRVTEPISLAKEDTWMTRVTTGRMAQANFAPAPLPLGARIVNQAVRGLDKVLRALELPR